MKHTDYLGQLLNPTSLKEAIKDAVEALKDIDFDSFAVTGYSGTVFGGALALKMGKGLFLVRKTTENCHSSYSVEGDDRYKRYIFLDDLISSGDTLRTVVKEMCISFSHVEFIGSYTYRAGWGKPAQFLASDDTRLVATLKGASF